MSPLLFKGFSWDVLSSLPLPFPSSFTIPFTPQTVYSSKPISLSFVPFPGCSIANMSDETYRGYVFSQQLALESAVLTSYIEIEELYCTHQELQSMFLCPCQQFDAYHEHNPCAFCINKSSYLARVVSG